MPELAYVNGSFGPIEEAVVPINDRGFLFGDSVYEVIVAYGASPFRLDAHLSRLQRSMSLVDMTGDVGGLGIERIVRSGIERSGFAETVIYIQITRGVEPRSHLYSDGLTPTVVATFRPKPEVAPQLRETGVSLVTREDLRWGMCEVKATCLLPNILAKNRAVRDGFYDTIFVSPDGHIRESTSANVFAIRAGEVITPAADESILHGVTRGYILECARRAGISVRHSPMTVPELTDCDEVFISSTIIDILPVTKLNNEPIGDGTVGPTTRRLYETFVEGVALPG
jgi:D-alanine transaminase